MEKSTAQILFEGKKLLVDITEINNKSITKNKLKNRVNRFVSLIKINEDSGCWEWVGAYTNGGYGIISVGGSMIRTHRFSYEIYVGRIPEGFIICHKCDNRKCSNPDHLFVGTYADNTADAMSKNRQYIPEGVKFKLGEGNKAPTISTTVREFFNENPSMSVGKAAKTLKIDSRSIRNVLKRKPITDFRLSDEEYSKIEYLLIEGKSVVEITKELNISHTPVYKIKNRIKNDSCANTISR